MPVETGPFAAHKRKDEADTALAILRDLIPDYDARVSGATVARVEAVAEHGGKREKGQGDNVTLKARGNSKDYIIGRLKRDSTENPKARRLLKRLEKGGVASAILGVEGFAWLRAAFDAGSVESGAPARARSLFFPHHESRPLAVPLK